jgi:hypothetical protein
MALTLSESLVLTVEVTASDSFAISEARIVTGDVLASDSFTVSDGVTLVGPDGGDTLTISEAASILRDLAATDALILTDGGVVSLASQNITASDTIYLGHSPNREGTDSVTLGDAGAVEATTSTTLVRDQFTLSDDGIVTEIPVGGTNITDSDSLTVSETNNSILTTSDGVEFTLSEAASLTASPPGVDAFTLNESSVLNIGPNTLPTDTDAIGLSEAAVIDALLASLDTVTLTDPDGVRSEAGSQFISTFDDLGLTDQASALQAQLAAPDSLTFSAETPTWTAAVAASESLAYTEQPVMITAIGTGVDTLTLADVGTQSEFAGVPRARLVLKAGVLADATVSPRVGGDLTIS